MSNKKNIENKTPTEDSVGVTPVVEEITAQKEVQNSDEKVLGTVPIVDETQPATLSDIIVVDDEIITPQITENSLTVNLETEVVPEEETNSVEENVENKLQHNGRFYGLSDRMPNKISLDGQVMSKEEILSNPDVFVSMIESKNIFIREL